MHALSILLLSSALVGGDGAKCPISGKPAKDEYSLEVNGKKITFCCENCPKAYEKKLAVKDEGPKECPMSHEKAKAETKLLVSKAEAVYFCCGGCPSKYEKSEKLEAVDKGPKKCPVCDMDAKKDHSLDVNAEKVYFCSEKCQKTYEKKLDVADKGPGKCPVSGQPGSKDQKLIRVKTEAVYFCCNDCRKKYIAKNFPAAKDEHGKAD